MMGYLFGLGGDPGVIFSSLHVVCHRVAQHPLMFSATFLWREYTALKGIKSKDVLTGYPQPTAFHSKSSDT